MIAHNHAAQNIYPVALRHYLAAIQAVKARRAHHRDAHNKRSQPLAATFSDEDAGGVGRRKRARESSGGGGSSGGSGGGGGGGGGEGHEEPLVFLTAGTLALRASMNRRGQVKETRDHAQGFKKRSGNSSGASRCSEYIWNEQRGAPM